MVKLIVQRDSGYADRMRTYRVVIDEREIGLFEMERRRPSKSPPENIDWR